MGRGFEKRVAAGLGHAADVAEDEMGTLFAELAEHSHFADRLLLGHVAHAAGVQQNHIGVGLCGHHAVAALDEHFRHLLGVALIHLAAVGFNIDAGHFGDGECDSERRGGQGEVCMARCDGSKIMAQRVKNRLDKNPSNLQISNPDYSL